MLVRFTLIKFRGCEGRNLLWLSKRCHIHRLCVQKWRTGSLAKLWGKYFSTNRITAVLHDLGLIVRHKPTKAFLERQSGRLPVTCASGLEGEGGYRLDNHATGTIIHRVVARRVSRLWVLMRLLESSHLRHFARSGKRWRTRWRLWVLLEIANETRLFLWEIRGIESSKEHFCARTYNRQCFGLFGDLGLLRNLLRNFVFTRQWFLGLGALTSWADDGRRNRLHIRQIKEIRSFC